MYLPISSCSLRENSLYNSPTTPSATIFHATTLKHFYFCNCHFSNLTLEFQLDIFQLLRLSTHSQIPFEQNVISNNLCKNNTHTERGLKFRRKQQEAVGGIRKQQEAVGPSCVTSDTRLNAARKMEAVLFPRSKTLKLARLFYCCRQNAARVATFHLPQWDLFLAIKYCLWSRSLMVNQS